MTTSMDATKATTAAEIRDAAVCRRRLGQTVAHRLLPYGQHEVSFYSPSAGEMKFFIGDTLDAAIAEAGGTS
jgi:hypothetical protein